MVDHDSGLQLLKIASSGPPLSIGRRAERLLHRCLYNVALLLQISLFINIFIISVSKIWQ